MPSVNLIWEQRQVRQKNQRIAIVLLALIGLGLLVMVEEVVRTEMKRRQCQAGIHACEVRIKRAQPLADRNRELQAQITAMEPTVALVQEAQLITLRWVRLFGELDGSLPDPKQAYLVQCSFSSGGAAAKKGQPGTIGQLSLSGAAQSYNLVAEMMRRLAAQAHMREVRLLQAQATEDEGIRFTCRAQFCVPDNEAALMTVDIEEQKKGKDYSQVLQKAGEDTVLNRAPVKETADTQ